MRAPDNNFVGATAETVVERIQFASGAWIPLSIWEIAQPNLVGVDSGGTWHTFDTDPFSDITMVNASNQTLCLPSGTAGSQTRLYWQQAL